MYYEERVIDGILHSRTSPEGKFEPVSQETLTTLLLNARSQVRALESV